jgi:aminocarboxymuconate-semialdehyde decarboxylase
MTESDDLALGAIDVHAHHIDPDAVAEMSRRAPGRAPTLRRLDARRWAVDLPPGFFKSFPEGTTRTVPAGLLDVETRLRDMARMRVATHVLGPYTYLNLYHLPGELAAELHVLHNDATIAAARGDPTHLIALPGVPMQAPELAAKEVRRLAALAEVAGIGIGTNVGGVDLDDERFAPFWSAIDATRLPVLIHPPGQVAGADRMRDYHLVNLVGNPTDSTVALGRIVLSGMLDRYPSLRILAVHGGGFLPYQIGRWDHGWRQRDDVRARTPRSPSTYLAGRIFFDSLTHSAESLRFLGERLGWEHVMLGTDYPWDMSTERPIEELREAGLDGDVLRRVARVNAERFLRLGSMPRSPTLDDATAPVR